MNHALPETTFSDLHFYRRHCVGLTSTTRDIIGPKAKGLGEETQNNGHYAVQGHSKSSISVVKARMRLSMCK